MNASYKNWLNYINSHVQFYMTKNKSNRNDDEFDWAWFNSTNSSFDKVKILLKDIIKNNSKIEWLHNNSEKMFEARQILEDDYSKLQYDLYLVLKVVGHNKFFFPRTYFDDFLIVQNVSNTEIDLPKEYSGFKLKEFDIKINNINACQKKINIITYNEFINISNKWRQYFIQKSNLNMLPSKGNQVIDCGSCIGDTSVIFAAFVGNTGRVHLFDPVPLHNKYCKIQAGINPDLSNVFKINQVAVGEKVQSLRGEYKDVKMIAPGGVSINNYDITTIDEYTEKNKINKIDLIKMDIEGAECDALRGASKVIRKDSPKLSIAGYHKMDDIWEIPNLIKRLNSKYKIYFEHHLPIFWESCFYAE